MRILVIRNGCCDTDIGLIMREIYPHIEINMLTSVDVIDLLKSKKIEIGSYDGVIVMGGYQSLIGRNDKDYAHSYLNVLIEYVKEWVANGTNVLGICLG